MSGHSYEAYCPNCREVCAQGYTDHKPFDIVSIHCLECGFYSQPVTGYQSLEELNESRQDCDMEPLDKLPEQDPEYKGEEDDSTRS